MCMFAPFTNFALNSRGSTLALHTGTGGQFGTFAGPIPERLGSLIELEHLNLSDNELTGERSHHDCLVFGRPSSVSFC